MNRRDRKSKHPWAVTSNDQGFTLVELLITLVVVLILSGGVYSVYALQQRGYRNQQLGLAAQQNMRGAMVILERQIRMAGYDPESTQRFGIVDVRRFDPGDGEANVAGEPVLSYTADMNENGDLDVSDDTVGRESHTFSIQLDPDSGRAYLAWDTGNGPEMLADNIQAMGFAYAVDVARDDRLDAWAGGQHTIWAVDSDNDNLLDTHLDANDDGVIDSRDDTNGDNRVTAADGAPLTPPVPIDRIRAVRVWVMSVSARPLQGYVNNRPHVVGDRIVAAANDGFQRKVLESIIDCRNL